MRVRGRWVPVRDYRYPLMINGVAVRIWAGSGRILVHVHDTGPGPADPVAGLVSVWTGPEQPEGGLWLVHMLGLDARALIRSRDGFTVRFGAGQAA